MAYVPPALRRKQQNAAGSPQQRGTPSHQPNLTDLPSLDDIQMHFWPNEAKTDQQATENADGQVNSIIEPESTHTVSRADESNSADENAHTSRKPHSTLNATEAEPNRLKYVLLFHNAHPRWHDDNIIYVKTDLHLLPQDDTSSSVEGASNVSRGNEIMVFEQSDDYIGQNTTRARFQFLGFYSLDQMQILEPKSPELVRMLEQKWTRTNKWGRSRQIERDSRSWQKSLSYRWAVLKFKKIDQAELQSSPPKIEASQPNGRSSGKENVPTMSVNDMLRGLRLKDQAKVDSMDDNSVEE